MTGCIGAKLVGLVVLAFLEAAEQGQLLPFREGWQTWPSSLVLLRLYMQSMRKYGVTIHLRLLTSEELVVCG